MKLGLAFSVIACAVALGACDPPRFDIVVLPPPMEDMCPSHPPFDSYAIITHRPGAPECVTGFCTRSNQSPFECLEGVETPIVEDGDMLRVEIVLFAARVGMAFPEMLLCGESMAGPNGSTISDGDEIVVPLKCDEPIMCIPAPCVQRFDTCVAAMMDADCVFPPMM